MNLLPLPVAVRRAAQQFEGGLGIVFREMAVYLVAKLVFRIARIGAVLKGGVQQLVRGDGAVTKSVEPVITVAEELIDLPGDQLRLQPLVVGSLADAELADHGHSLGYGEPVLVGQAGGGIATGQAFDGFRIQPAAFDP